MSAAAETEVKDTAKTSSTKPFARFEWMIAGRYLRSRRKDAGVSVIAGFSFIGILLGVAALIIVMSVMNGFRTELLTRILGVNGHVVMRAVDTPLTDFNEVTERISAKGGSLSKTLLADRDTFRPAAAPARSGST